MSVIGYQMLIATGAALDMEKCRSEDAYAAATISAHLRELRGDPNICARLVDEHYSDEVIGDVEPVWSLQSKRINAYRVKYLLLGRWRLITGADWPKKRIVVLAVMPRDADYEKNRGLWERIENEYDELGFPYLGR
ncbi:hypothetical protein ASG11_09875 [Sphingomonas sp. Leaf357]|uniref:hypothetical protein n=1 Tax=Sphingomonas sp. Leaf357 TaxID=1736350 RepID=UPI0006F3341E|nr:hypothetical protein [Sphingomonas sp. Leaf357]KQS04518.1 hypothetical protein ASG11_09875 [Sphingomonas sp. Leaf357]